jgi:hypothetical protein
MRWVAIWIILYVLMLYGGLILMAGVIFWNEPLSWSWILATGLLYIVYDGRELIAALIRALIDIIRTISWLPEKRTTGIEALYRDLGGKPDKVARFDAEGKFIEEQDGQN